MQLVHNFKVVYTIHSSLSINGNNTTRYSNSKRSCIVVIDSVNLFDMTNISYTKCIISVVRHDIFMQKIMSRNDDTS